MNFFFISVGLGREEEGDLRMEVRGDGKEVSLVWEGMQVLHLVEGKRV